MKCEVGKDEPAKAVHGTMHDIHFVALSEAEQRFQINDHIVHFGALVRVEEVGKQNVVVRHVGAGYPEHPITLGKADAARERRGYWLGEPEPEHRLQADAARGYPCCEPYTFSHFPTGKTWEIYQPELDGYRASVALAGYSA